MSVTVVKKVLRDKSPEQVKKNIIKALDTEIGAFFCSDYTYPGRYQTWEVGFIKPQLVFRAHQLCFEIELMNMESVQSKQLLEILAVAIQSLKMLAQFKINKTILFGQLNPSCVEKMTEEERSKQSSIFDVIRVLQSVFKCEDSHFGLYGSFGYDLMYQFEKIQFKHQRQEEYPDLILYLPQILYVKEEGGVNAKVYQYSLEMTKTQVGALTGVSQIQAKSDDKEKNDSQIGCSLIQEHSKKHYEKGDYAHKVRKAIPYFERGDLFEVVPSYERYSKTKETASALFERLRTINPSPYAFLINMDGEHLIGTSPEMYVRVKNKRVETCPISGTIGRGRDALGDCEQIKILLNSTKEESELTMCTDVDRNDKSKVCKPESVRVIGRRQIEMYSHLIHTVDHVEGTLEDHSDSIDAFIAHMWAVTVTGAPKKAAIQWIENEEDTPRKWYGGAVGKIAMNGDLHTGLTLRAIHLKQEDVSIRVGATLLYDSIPADEEAETVIKALAMEKALSNDGHDEKRQALQCKEARLVSPQIPQIVIVDHEDSFVHTLAGYFKASGCQVKTIRRQLLELTLKNEKPHLVVLSPGPGTPESFKLSESINLCQENDIPLFGVCLGLQGIVEYFGGQLGQLSTPVHGKKSVMTLTNEGSRSNLFVDVPQTMFVGRYHSLYAALVPSELLVTATTEDGVPMAVEHNSLPIYAVQFHPESIMTAGDGIGRKLIENMVEIAQLEMIKRRERSTL